MFAQSDPHHCPPRTSRHKFEQKQKLVDKQQKKTGGRWAEDRVISMANDEAQWGRFSPMTSTFRCGGERGADSSKKIAFHVFHCFMKIFYKSELFDKKLICWNSSQQILNDNTLIIWLFWVSDEKQRRRCESRGEIAQNQKYVCRFSSMAPPSPLSPRMNLLLSNSRTHNSSWSCLLLKLWKSQRYNIFVFPMWQQSKTTVRGPKRNFAHIMF